jgi:hypothetical protein
MSYQPKDLFIAITDFLERNAKFIQRNSLVEIARPINGHAMTWREYNLIAAFSLRIPARDDLEGIDERQTALRTILLTRVQKGDKSRSCHECLDWLPIYFGILKNGALAVRCITYTSDEIKYCWRWPNQHPDFRARVHRRIEQALTISGVKRFLRRQGLPPLRQLRQARAVLLSNARRSS